MPFNIGVSGINAASADLEVIGNNVANVGTTGFKSSRAEFGDLYAASALTITGANQTGSGVRLTDIHQNMTQGNVAFTDNPLDMAIDGVGFFRLSNEGSIVYSRAGAFHTDKEGYVVNANGLRLTGFTADGDGNLTGQLGDLQIDTANIVPTPTTEVDAGLNLDSTDTAPTMPWSDAANNNGTFAFGDPPPDPLAYNSSTSLTIYDSLGNPHAMSMYFVKDDTTPNSWDVHVLVDGVTVGGSPADTLTFLEDGTIDPAGTLSIALADWDPLDAAGNPTGATTPQPMDLDFADTTQFGSSFAVQALSQDGYASGRLSGVDVDIEGNLFARYTNGQAKNLGQVALASFANLQGLAPLGDASWAETFASGQPLVGAPATASLGVIQAGALEESNVNLTQELVNLIIAQRNFQANAKTIETADAVTQTIINIR
jgi:flagellar hook protein FlgE